jgi:thiamine kinase-like enzyme
VTLWRYFPAIDPASDFEQEVARAYTQLREALDSYAGDLPNWIVPVLACARLARSDSLPGLLSSQVDLLRRVFGAARNLVTLQDAASCPLHGDPHPGNLLFTGDGPLWLDFESACRGPLEWDLSALPVNGELPPHDPALLSALRRLRSACVAVWCLSKERPSRKEREAAAFHMAQLEGKDSMPGSG